MRVWTDGARVRVWHPRGRFCLTSRGEVTWETRGAADHPDPLVALTDAGNDLLARALAPHGAVRVAAVAVDTDRTAEVHLPNLTSRRARGPILRVGPPDGTPDLELPLVGRPAPIDWPRGLLWERLGLEAWTCGEVFAGTAASQAHDVPLKGGGLSLTRSPFGLGIGANMSGHVAVLRAADVSLSHLGRLPTGASREGPASVEVFPLSAGALVCVATGPSERRRAALLLLGDDGAVIARWPPEDGLVCGAANPSLALSSGGGVVSHGSTLSLLRVPSLEVSATVDCGETIVDLACANDGFAALGASGLHLGRVAGASLAIEQALSLDALEQARSLPAAGWQPDKETGPTNVEAAVQKAPPWRARAGEAFRLELRLRSVGRAGRALRVRASGPAIEAGHLELTRAWTRDDEAHFRADGCAHEARLERAIIPQGYKRPVVPKPKNQDQRLTAQALLEGSRLELVVEGRALAPGRALLRLEIGGIDGAPFRWTRPFLVE